LFSFDYFFKMFNKNYNLSYSETKFAGNWF